MRLDCYHGMYFSSYALDLLKVEYGLRKSCLHSGLKYILKWCYFWQIKDMPKTTF